MNIDQFTAPVVSLAGRGVHGTGPVLLRGREVLCRVEEGLGRGVGGVRLVGDWGAKGGRLLWAQTLSNYSNC